MLDFSFYMMTKHEVRLQQQVVRQVQVCTRLCANFYIFLVQADSSPGICYLFVDLINLPHGFNSSKKN